MGFKLDTVACMELWSLTGVSVWVYPNLEKDSQNCIEQIDSFHTIEYLFNI